MGAFEHISKMYRYGIRNKAGELGYSDANLCVLDGNVAALKNSYRNVFENILSCSHNKDCRSIIEYAKDLVASWIFEDTMVQVLNLSGIETVLSGTDRNREILGHANVSSCSDCLISFCGKCRHLEIVSDYTGWWELTGHMELRDSKFENLKRERSLLLGVCTDSLKYVLLDFSKPVSANYIVSHKPCGGKSAWSIEIKKEELKKFSIPHLVEHLKSDFSDF